MILGLDISSSVIGVSLMNFDGTLAYHDFIDLRTTTKAKKLMFKDIFDKQKFCEQWFNDRIKTFQDVKEIHIEEALTKFKRGKSSMHTLQMLFKMNYVISFIVFKMLGLKPIYWHPTEARKEVGLKMPKGSDIKAIVFAYARRTHKSFDKAIPAKLPKSHPWIDAADAIVIATAGVVSYNKRHGKRK